MTSPPLGSLYALQDAVDDLVLSYCDLRYVRYTRWTGKKRTSILNKYQVSCKLDTNYSKQIKIMWLIISKLKVFHVLLKCINNCIDYCNTTIGSLFSVHSVYWLICCTSEVSRGRLMSILITLRNTYLPWRMSCNKEGSIWPEGYRIHEYQWNAPTVAAAVRHFCLVSVR